MLLFQKQLFLLHAVNHISWKWNIMMWTEVKIVKARFLLALLKPCTVTVQENQLMIQLHCAGHVATPQFTFHFGII